MADHVEIWLLRPKRFMAWFICSAWSTTKVLPLRRWSHVDPRIIFSENPFGLKSSKRKQYMMEKKYKVFKHWASMEYTLTKDMLQIIIYIANLWCRKLIIGRVRPHSGKKCDLRRRSMDIWNTNPWIEFPVSKSTKNSSWADILVLFCFSF